jgi:WD40 repeat protein
VPPFDLEPETWRGVDWPLLQNGFVTLFSDPRFFADICAQLTADGYRVVELAAGGWTAEDAAHTAFSSALASASWDRTMKLWDVEPTEPEAVLTIPLPGPATAIAWSPNGELIAAATTTQVVILAASGNQ